MQVIGFFSNLFQQLGQLWAFVTTPLGQLNGAIGIEPFKSMSIIDLLGASLVSCLLALLAIHFVKLFL